MMTRQVLITLLLVGLVVFGSAGLVHGQSYDLLLKGGHVIDPKSEIDGPMDVAVKDGIIAKVDQQILDSDASKVIDVAGYYVTPGLIDIHTHVFVGSRPEASPGGFSGAFANGFSSVSPDDFTFRTGITTVVDAGTSGWRNFSVFKEQVIDQSDTRILAFLNIVGFGMRDQRHNQIIDDMNSQLTSSLIQRYPDILVGTKIGHFETKDWTPFERALEVGRITNSPLLLECHLPELPLQELLARMRPGDIFTHAFGQVHDRESVLDEQGKVRDYIFEAKEKGILFDVGHGGVSFHFSQAIPAMKQGLMPDSFGTDLHRFSMNAGMKNMLNIMSKYLNMGMKLKDIILRATWNPAKSIKREDLGNLSEGAVADLAVLNMKRGDYGFVDAGGYKIKGDYKLEVELTVRAGQIVWDLNGIAAQMWDE